MSDEAEAEKTKFKTSDEIWDMIRNSLADSGFIFKTSQVISKWQKLRKSYVKFIDPESGKEFKTCPYFKKLNSIFEKALPLQRTRGE